jgi:DNA-binding transcriptional ArsR family regulator
MSRPISTESVFRAVADPTRRRILELLRAGERSPVELQGSFQFSKPTLSHHLGVLRITGLIHSRRRGRGLRYRLNAPALRQISAWSDRFDRIPTGRKQQPRQPA